ncbi:MAG: D-alanyl-D-alanine carboxypeptidase/D-alanyl-D-alanine endopeptidase, partial [Thiobacillus sp.]
LPSPLLVNYSATTFKLKPVTDGVQITPDIALQGITIDSRLISDEAACDEWKERLGPIRFDSISNAVIFEGRYARSCDEKQLNLNVLPPPRHFDLVFRALWKDVGGTLSGRTLTGTAPVDTPAWMSFTSIPLAEALRNQNKFSNNLMTRNVFLTLGAAQVGAPATLAKSEQVVRTWLTEKQIPATELVLENGAGLSRIERISAQTLVRVLQAAYASPYFAEFESSLPILGVDGTLRKRVTEPALKGRAHLKTGTLQDVRTLAGYVLNRDGKRLVLVMMINHPNAARAELAQHVLLTWAYGYRAAPMRTRRNK